MGFGEQPAGIGLAGLSQVTGLDRAAAPAPAALAFDGQTKNFKLSAEGGYEGQHPVDAKFWLVMRTALASIRSAVHIGQGVSNIAYIDPRTIQATVVDYVRVAAQPMVRAGEVRVESVEVDTAVRGRIVFRVTYVNLITGRRQTPGFAVN